MEGGQISKRQSVFSGDGKLILAPVGSSVALFAAATGEQVGQLEGHNGDVCCVHLDPQEPLARVSETVETVWRPFGMRGELCRLF